MYARLIGGKGAYIIGHPPTDTKLLSHVICNETRPAFPYLDRDKHIVAESTVMIATPGTQKEVVRSGTWATIRYTRAAKKPLYIIFPDGTYQEE